MHRRATVTAAARGRAAQAATLALVLLAACGEDPVAPTPRPVTTSPAGVAIPVPAASVPTRVEVPASMRSAPFDVARDLTVPPDFRVAVYARVPGARMMAVAPNGDLLVSNPADSVIRLVRANPGGDPTVTDWAAGLYLPHDIVFHTIGGTTWVYVGEGDKITRYRYTSGDAVGQGREVVVSGLPSASTPELRGAYGHELKNIALDGDHRLYVSIASTCNACVGDAYSTPLRGAIYVYEADGSNGRLFARGLRNAEGLAVVPGTNTLWAAVNSRDDIAYPFHGDITGDGADDYGRVVQGYVDEHPAELFTRVRDGGHYGWPFCNSNPDTPAGLDDMWLDRDVQFNADGSQLDCNAIDRATRGLPPHSAPLGLTFFQGTAAPSRYRQGAAIALHGSWNRARKSGYSVVFAPWDPAAGSGGRPAPPVDLVTGWASDFNQWGRPVDVAVGPTGTIFVSDDYSGTIYALLYAPPRSEATQPLVSRMSGRCLDVLGAGRDAGTPIVIYSCYGGENQRFSMPAPGASGEVRAYGGALCLDAYTARGNNGDPIVVWPCNGAANQQWTRTAAGELRGINGRCVDVRGQETADLTPVWLWDCHDGANQRWDATSPATTNVELLSRASGKCLDVFGALRDVGTGLDIYPCHGGANQRFTLPAVGGTGEVRGVDSELCLDAYTARGDNGDPIVIWPCNGAVNQQWTRTAAGELRGINGRCVDVRGRETGDLTPVWLWDCHGGDNQRWDARE